MLDVSRRVPEVRPVFEPAHVQQSPNRLLWNGKKKVIGCDSFELLQRISGLFEMLQDLAAHDQRNGRIFLVDFENASREEMDVQIPVASDCFGHDGLFEIERVEESAGKHASGERREHAFAASGFKNPLGLAILFHKIEKLGNVVEESFHEYLFNGILRLVFVVVVSGDILHF